MGVNNARESTAEWQNPGNQYLNPLFNPRRFFIGAEDGKIPVFPARNDLQMNVYIVGDVEQNDPALQVGFQVFSAVGDALYISLVKDGREPDWPILRPGTCKVRSPLPRRFFNEGTYRLELFVGLHYRHWICQPGVSSPGIQFTILGGLSDSPQWTLPRAG